MMGSIILVGVLLSCLIYAVGAGFTYRIFRGRMANDKHKREDDKDFEAGLIAAFWPLTLACLFGYDLAHKTGFMSNGDSKSEDTEGNQKPADSSHDSSRKPRGPRSHF